MYKRSECDIARQLYNEGLGYNAIAEKLKASKSTISLWCRDLAEVRRAKSMSETMQRKAQMRAIKKQNAEQRFINRKGKLVSWGLYKGHTLYEYIHKDGHMRIQLVNRATNSFLNMTRARYNMSLHLNRMIEPYEIVVHVSTDRLDDSIDNIKLLVKHAPRVDPTRECKTCQKSFKPSFTLRKYCSVTCQTAENMGPRVHNSLVDNECVICETNFKSERRAEICSNKCRKMLTRLQFHDMLKGNSG